MTVSALILLISVLVASLAIVALFLSLLIRDDGKNLPVVTVAHWLFYIAIAGFFFAGALKGFF
jgi:hypothetical protein